MKYFASQVLLPSGWAENVTLEVNGQGRWSAIVPNSSDVGCKRLGGPVIPGMPNTHSHAFQYEMAGLAEWRSSGKDSFWTWRETMYRFAGKVTEESLFDTAVRLYQLMLNRGYTSVCEFHYVHHDNEGKPYADRAALSNALIAAARATGIRLILLPVLYLYGGFGRQELSLRQRRFQHSVHDYLGLVQQLMLQEDAQLSIGTACHSLRAVGAEELDRVVEFVFGQDKTMPFHLHIAEQEQEVIEAKKYLGTSPVDWLLRRHTPGSNWALVHATHLTDDECNKLADSDAVVALCPSTEANLGDGLFPLANFLSRDGAFGIGSDSQISVSPIEELRWLEYGQRLIHRQRNIACDEANNHVGANLWQRAVAGGASVSGFDAAGIKRAGVADFLVLNEEALPGVTHKHQWLDALVFAGDASWIRGVYVGGQKIQN